MLKSQNLADNSSIMKQVFQEEWVREICSAKIFESQNPKEWIITAKNIQKVLTAIGLNSPHYN